MKKLKSILISLIATLAMAVAPTMVYAQSTADVCEGVNFASGQSCDATNAEGNVKNVIKLSIQILQMVVGIISVFVLITAGLNYITSGGDASKTMSAKDKILYAAVGLVVVVLAQVIVSFVLNRVESVI